MAEGDARTAKLVSRAKAGDRAAFDDLFARAAEGALLFLSLRLGRSLAGKLEPMDLLQEGYLEAYRSFDRFEYSGERSFSRWLCRILENRIREAADHFGAQKRSPPGAVRPVSEILDVARKSTAGPATAFARAEQNERLSRALAALEEDERTALVLRFFQDRTLEEIASALGKSVGSARRLLGRATLKIGEELAELERVTRGL